MKGDDHDSLTALTDKKPKLAILYQQMSPTRVPVFDALHRTLGERVRVFYPCVVEGDRDARWQVPVHHRYHLLKARSVSYTLYSMKRYVHVNPDVYAALAAYDPDCVTIYNLNVTSLIAWYYTRVRNKRFIVATDACLRSDRKNTVLHRIVRRMVIPTATAAVGTSRNSLDLFNRYGDFSGRYFYCYLCADNERFAPFRSQPREYDLAFAGQFIPRKMPHFFADVVARIQRRKQDVSAVLLGDGPQRPEVLARLDAMGVRYRYTGFAPTEDVPKYLAAARLFLFPSLLDAYGVVANEAMAVGTPVIISPEPGAAGEVVLDRITGSVLPLDADAWATSALELLNDSCERERLSRAAFQHVQKYNFDVAARGLKEAFDYAMDGRRASNEVGR